MGHRLVYLVGVGSAVLRVPGLPIEVCPACGEYNPSKPQASPGVVPWLQGHGVPLPADVECYGVQLYLSRSGFVLALRSSEWSDDGREYGALVRSLGEVAFGSDGTWRWEPADEH